MIAIVGAGAFGTALAQALGGHGQDVVLWARNPARVQGALPGVTLTGDAGALAAATITLLCVPAQALAGFLAIHARALAGHPVACCKGIDLATGTGPTALIAAALPGTSPSILTGPGFAGDIARGLPTALTLACRNETVGLAVQQALSTQTLRLYRTQDVTGAELGGALKNVIAIAAGLATGAGLGDSARAAVITRGYAEMLRLAVAMGARPETLAGLSGLGDLVLTATSPQSRNFRFGMSLGEGRPATLGGTVEGVATARAVCGLAQRQGIDMPLTTTVDGIISGRWSLDEAIGQLLSRPLKPES